VPCAGVAARVKEPEVVTGKLFDMFVVGEVREVLDLGQEERRQTLAHTREAGEPLKLRESCGTDDKLIENVSNMEFSAFDQSKEGVHTPTVSHTLIGAAAEADGGGCCVLERFEC
jgi:hypothetical protein